MGQLLSNLMANSNKTYKNSPIIVVLGATGTGKSKLAIQLAKIFNGEIVSADSMQVYKGLDIVTNKVSLEEQSQVAHHFIECVDPLSRYTVVDFRNQALPIINNLHQNHKLPIIVGGTNYYIESLLWNILIKPEENASSQLLYEAEKNISDYCVSPVLSNPQNKSSIDSGLEICSENFSDILKINITQSSCDKFSNEILHKLLNVVDPAMASVIHPNDRRKVIRSLQVYQQHQCRHSEFLSMQRAQEGGSILGGPLRYKNSIMLWIQCDKTVLDKRLDERVDKMLEAGLMRELLNFHHTYNQQRLIENPDAKYTEGIFQSIGFKEFHEYLILTEEERQSKTGMKMYTSAIEAMKVRTKKYATKQKRWIKNRFLRNPSRDLPPVYGLNGSDLNQWKENVFGTACDIVRNALQGKTPQVSPLPIEEYVPDIPTSYYCDICDKVLIGQKVWEEHIASKKHARVKRSKKRKLSCTNLEK